MFRAGTPRLTRENYEPQVCADRLDGLKFCGSSWRKYPITMKESQNLWEGNGTETCDGYLTAEFSVIIDRDGEPPVPGEYTFQTQTCDGGDLSVGSTDNTLDLLNGRFDVVSRGSLRG